MFKVKLKTYINALRAAVAVLVLTLHFWIALSQPSAAILGLCAGLCLISLIAFAASQRLLFTLPLLALTIVLIYVIVTASAKDLASQMIHTLQFLLLLYAVEAGTTAMYFNRILQRAKGHTYNLPMIKAIKNYAVNLTATIATIYTLTCSLLFVGNLTQVKFELIFIVAAATAILLAALVFFTSNLQFQQTRQKQ